eukprot:scaffold23007_cov60-Phaeocystis_antarctica.AAC.9
MRGACGCRAGWLQVAGGARAVAGRGHSPCARGVCASEHVRVLAVPLEGRVRSCIEIQLQVHPSVQRQLHPVTRHAAGRQPVSDGRVGRTQHAARVDAYRAPTAELLQRASHGEPHHRARLGRPSRVAVLSRCRSEAASQELAVILLAAGRVHQGGVGVVDPLEAPLRVTLLHAASHLVWVVLQRAAAVGGLDRCLSAVVRDA